MSSIVAKGMPPFWIFYKQKIMNHAAAQAAPPVAYITTSSNNFGYDENCEGYATDRDTQLFKKKRNVFFIQY